MMMDKDNFIKNFKDGNYSTCIKTLREEIKKYLIKQIKIINPNYSYVSISQLKDYSMQYLSENEKSAALMIYEYTYEEVPEEIELDDLFEAYKLLIK